MGLLAGDGGGSYNASCGRTSGLVWNLTSSYADQSNEASMVSATVIMFLLAALFFNLNLFSGLSDASAILDPKVRVALSKALSLFLPVMSYLFSEAKNAGAGASGGELPLRARLILTWMLLVELLRNKVEEIPMQQQQGDGWHKGTVERAGRVAWLGSLVFFNLLFPSIVLLLCLVIVVLCGNGDVLFTFRSVESDNYTVSFGVVRMAKCLLTRVATSPSVFFSTIDLSITLLLFLVLVYEQVWEFVVFLFSNWFLVSLLHGYATTMLHWRRSATFSWAIRRILWVRSKMSHPDLTMKHFSVLRSCRILVLPSVVSFSLTLPTLAVPKEVKHSIAEYLLATATNHDGLVSNGKLAVAAHQELRRGCESESVAEVILAWHIATCLFEERERCRQEAQAPACRRRDVVVATTLSKYCAYLVAFHPELLPDNQDKTERVFEAMEEELRRTVGFWSYYLPTVAALVGGGEHEQIMGLAEKLGMALELVPEMTTLQRGASLARALEEEVSSGGVEGMWKVLADLWVQLVVYVAPTSVDDQERVMGHAKVLPEGGEFVTVLWALATHTGIRRAPAATVDGMQHA